MLFRSGKRTVAAAVNGNPVVFDSWVAASAHKGGTFFDDVPVGQVVERQIGWNNHAFAYGKACGGW